MYQVRIEGLFPLSSQKVSVECFHYPKIGLSAATWRIMESNEKTSFSPEITGDVQSRSSLGQTLALQILPQNRTRLEKVVEHSFALARLM